MAVRAQTPVRIDTHSHCVPRVFLEATRRQEFAPAVQIVAGASGEQLVYTGVSYGPGAQQRYPVLETYWDVGRRISEMERARVDIALVSPAPFIFHYWAAPRAAAALAQAVNDELAHMVSQSHGRFLGLGQVPLQAPRAAVDEAIRCMDRLGMRGIAIATNVGGKKFIWDPAYTELFSAVHARGGVILLHPHDVVGAERMQQYYLRNLIGNPTDTGLAAAGLVFSGLFERCPDLKLVLSHGGGILPAVLGRLDHGWRVRPEACHLPQPPSTYLRRCFYDTLTHSREGLRFLIDLFGADHVVLGSDYPFDMGTPDPAALVEEAARGDELPHILGNNAAALLGLVGSGT